jgi:integrase
MVLVIRLKYVQELSRGRKRFRRRYLAAVRDKFETDNFQVDMKAKEGAAFLSEYAMLMRAFDAEVAKASRTAEELENLSDHVKWSEALKDADKLVRGASGFDGNNDDDTYDPEVETRRLVAEQIKEAGGDPLLFKALVQPHAPAPELTLQDAKDFYVKEFQDGASKTDVEGLERICTRWISFKGPLKQFPLRSLKRSVARDFVAYLQAVPALGRNKPLKTRTIERELQRFSVMISRTLEEHDLDGQITNPFKNLRIKDKAGRVGKSSHADREPLPVEVILQMRARLLRPSIRRPELGLIWRLLEGTGCRGSEIIGLRVEDVHLATAYPHVVVEWHEERRIKTDASVRTVPLVGDALEAAKEAVERAGKSKMLFEKYAYERGADAVSKSLMTNLRKFTNNERHVVYSLRHNMKDYLMKAGVGERDENLILGHDLGSVGSRVYGGDEGRLARATEAMVAAHKFMP